MRPDASPALTRPAFARFAFACALAAACSGAAASSASSAAASAMPDPAFHARCESQLPPSQVALRVSMADYRVDRTVSSRVLGMKSDQARPGDKMLGMTSIKSIIEFGYDGPSIEDQASSQECIAPQIDIELRYMPVEVYVAREFPRDTCSYREIMAHELRHVDAYQQQLPRLQEAVLAALRERFSRGPIYGASGKTFAALKQEVDGQWIPFIRAELKKLDALHSQIDTDEESWRMSNACHGEVAMTLNSHY